MTEESCQPVATDAQGRQMKLHQVLTYCDVENIARGREYALQFMTMPKRKNSGITSVNHVLDKPLRPLGGGEITHWGCIRPVWCDEVAEIDEFRKVSADCPEFKAVIVDEGIPLDEILKELGLEVAK